MAHHLAALIAAGSDDTQTTPEQRREICELILEIWKRRQRVPGPRRPLASYDYILTALDRLGDNRPFRFFLNNYDDIPRPDEADNADLELVQLSADLEDLVRETITRLLWLAMQQAEGEARPWFTLVDKLAETIELDANQAADRLNRRMEIRQRLRAGDKDARALLVEPFPPDEPFTPDDLDADIDDESDETADPPTPFSDQVHAERLRAMARQLNAVADTLVPADDAGGG